MKFSVWFIIAVFCLQGGSALAAGYWSTPQLFTPANSSSADWSIAFSADELIFYVNTERDGHFADTQVYRADRPDTSSPWSIPIPVNELNSSLHNGLTWVSSDGLEAYLYYKGNPNPLYDIYRSTRISTSDPWSAQSPVTELNTSDRDNGLVATADGLFAMFTSTRSGGQGSNDIWATSRPDRSSPWSTPINVTELNTSSGEGIGHLSPDGLTVLISSNRPGSAGDDIWMATRSSMLDPFSVPVLVDGINSPSAEYDSYLSSDGQTLYFHSSRSGSPGSNAIWYSTWVPEPITLSMDIKPNNCPNTLPQNVRGKGRIAMAILGTNSFDVTEIDINSISIVGTVAPIKIPSSDKDKSAPVVDGGECDCHMGADGINDLMIYFSKRDIIVALGLDAMEAGTVVPITVEGMLLDGTPFTATDCVKLVGRRD